MSYTVEITELQRLLLVATLESAVNYSPAEVKPDQLNMIAQLKHLSVNKVNNLTIEGNTFQIYYRGKVVTEIVAPGKSSALRRYYKIYGRGAFGSAVALPVGSCDQLVREAIAQSLQIPTYSE